MKKYLSGVCFVLALSIAGCTDPARNKVSNDVAEQKTADPVLKGVIDGFFERYRTNPGNALDYLFASNKSFTPEQVADLKSKLLEVVGAIGPFYGVEQITTTQTSPSLVLFSYLVKHERQPLRFTFIFYKPQDAWVLYRVKYDDRMDTELQEAAKIYFQK